VFINKQNVMRYSLFLLFLFGLISCRSCREKYDDELCSTRQPNTQSPIRIDGYYTFSYNEGASETNYVLYQNGIFLDPHLIPIPEGLTLTQHIANLNVADQIKSNKHNWGIYYFVGDSKMIFEKWFSGGNVNQVFRTVCEITSDTSFKEIYSSRCSGAEYKEEFAEYFFVPQTQKPDSTNEFVK
jgi:hypothetical protein